MTEPKSTNLRLRETPEQDQPRERLLKVGAVNLRLAELFSILIRSGRPGESALQGGEKLAACYSEKLDRLVDVQQAELKAISPAVAKTAYCQIMAGIELGRRVASAAAKTPGLSKIGSSEDAISYCEAHFRRLIVDGTREEFHILCLNTKNVVIDTHQISVGTLDASLVHPREVFRPAIKDAASSIILVHNHPSGDPTPSREDLLVTERLEQCGKTLGVDVLDHIVLGSFRSLSIRENR